MFEKSIIKIFFFIAGTELLPTDESVEDAPSKYYGDSVVTTKNTEEDNVKISTLIAETVDDAKFANSKEEMQGKLDNGGASKGNNFTKNRQDFTLRYLTTLKTYTF